MQWFHMLHVCSSSVIDFPQKLSHKIKLPISNTIVAHLHVTSFQLKMQYPAKHKHYLSNKRTNL